MLRPDPVYVQVTRVDSAADGADENAEVLVGGGKGVQRGDARGRRGQGAVP